ncbi:MAG: hypothetical protein ACKPKO_20730, partial [Candidatus Fonsibacter sp.]
QDIAIHQAGGSRFLSIWTHNTGSWSSSSSSSSSFFMKQESRSDQWPLPRARLAHCNCTK